MNTFERDKPGAKKTQTHDSAAPPNLISFMLRGWKDDGSKAPKPIKTVGWQGARDRGLQDAIRHSGRSRPGRAVSTPEDRRRGCAKGISRGDGFRCRCGDLTRHTHNCRTENAQQGTRGVPVRDAADQG